MGGFYGSVQLRTDDRPRVLAAAGAVAAERGIKCLVGPPLGGWVGVYPEGSGQDDTVGQQIAERVGGYAIHLLVHDDDILAYWLWADGKLVDRYHSSPGYFGDENRAEEEPLVGDLKQFAFVLDSAGQAKLARLIDRDAKEVFEVERLRRLGKLLGIENVLTSYEYLQERDGSPVKGRRQFIELPGDGPAAAKRIAEKAAKAAEAKRVRDERKRVKSAGLLLAQFDDAAFHGGAAAIAGGFLRFPAPHDHEQPSSLNFHSPPWKAAERVGFDLPPRSNPFNFCADPSGRRVAAQADHAIRVWDWDGVVAKCLGDIPTVQFAGVLDISADGKVVAVSVPAGANSKTPIVVHELDSRRVLAKIDVESFGPVIFSPDRRSLVIASGSIDWIDLSDPGHRRHFEVFGVTPERDLVAEEKVRARRAAEISKEIESVRDELASFQTRQAGPRPLPPEEAIQTEVWAESMSNRLQKKLRDLNENRRPPEPPLAERVSCIGFSRDGRWFWCGSDRRLQVFEASGFAGRTSDVPKPVWSAKPPSDSEYAHVHTVVEEHGGEALVFGGIGGVILRLDLRTGVVRTLMRVPGATFVTGLAMSCDGRHLGVASMENRVGTLNCWFQVWDNARLLD